MFNGRNPELHSKSFSQSSLTSQGTRWVNPTASPHSPQLSIHVIFTSGLLMSFLQAVYSCHFYDRAPYIRRLHVIFTRITTHVTTAKTRFSHRIAARRCVEHSIDYLFTSRTGLNRLRHFLLPDFSSKTKGYKHRYPAWSPNCCLNSPRETATDVVSLTSSSTSGPRGSGEHKFKLHSVYASSPRGTVLLEPPDFCKHNNEPSVHPVTLCRFWKSPGRDADIIMIDDIMIDGSRP